MRSDLIRVGDQFGEWIVLGEGTKPSHSLCKCSCGTIKEVNNSTLRLGKSRSCGHKKAKRLVEEGYKKSDDAYLGKKFGRLYVEKRVTTKGRSKYLCKCDCGNKIIVDSASLGRRVNSCGCLKSDKSKKLMENIQEKGHDKLKSLKVEGTSLASLKSTLSKNNSSGYTGVSYNKKSKKYRAYITLKGKQKHLGEYSTAEEAYQARLDGEEKYFEPILEKYKDKINEK